MENGHKHKMSCSERFGQCGPSRELTEKYEHTVAALYNARLRLGDHTPEGVHLTGWPTREDVEAYRRGVDAGVELTECIEATAEMESTAFAGVAEGIVRGMLKGLGFGGDDEC